MVIKVYISSCSGSMETKRKQDFITSILESYRIPFEEIDISESSRDADRQFMRTAAKPSGSDRVPLPPQIFNDKIYIGNYDAFHEANENNVLTEFLECSTDSSQKTPAISRVPDSALMSSQAGQNGDGQRDEEKDASERSDTDLHDFSDTA